MRQGGWRETTMKEARAKEKGLGKKQRTRMVNFRRILLALLVLCLVTLASLFVFIGVTLAQNYDIDESKLAKMEQTTKIYDRNGNEVDRLFIQNREYVPLEEIPDIIVSTFVAVEDERFYSHFGVDLKGIVRAAVKNIMSGSTVQGASTITQQLARNVFLSHERTFARKIREALIALKLERRYEKDEILEMYLNYIYFGAGAYGIKAAAKTYFGKEDLYDLTIGEVAMLAALPKGPNLYNPLEEENKERAEERRQVVLSVMERHGIITAEERKEAAETELTFNTQRPTENPALDTYIDMVLDEAKERYGLTSDDIYTGGFQIYTNLDVNAQEILYETFRKDGPMADELFPPDGPEQIVQGSMVILDHTTGEVLAAIGGRDYQPRGINRATRDARSPGSAIKPITVYAPALEAGWHPYDTVWDEQRDYNGYKPRNYSRRYYGPVTMMYALQQSLNAASVWLLNEIGLDKGLEAAQAFGIKTEPGVGLAVALGGGVQTSPLSMARAYSAFANNGIIMEPYLIKEIIDAEGGKVAVHQPEYKQVISEQTAWYMTEMLLNVVKNGTGKNAQFKHPVAGKTGTNEYAGGKGNQDAWFVGYTPYLTAAVWLGYDVTDDRHNIETTGGGLPAKIFKHVMSQVMENYPVKSFQKPGGVTELKPPVELKRITDLKAFLRITGPYSFAVDLEFSQQNDDRVAYNIYRTDARGARTLMATINRGQSWSDTNVALNESYTYEVLPVNKETGMEGPPSNRVTVTVSLDYPFLRFPDGIDQEKIENWMREMLGIPLEEEKPDDVEEPRENEDEDVLPINPPVNPPVPPGQEKPVPETPNEPPQEEESPPAPSPEPPQPGRGEQEENGSPGDKKNGGEEQPRTGRETNQKNGREANQNIMAE